MEYNIDNAELTATLTAVNLDAAVIGQAPLEVAIGESARIDVGQAINYVKAGAAEIAAAVDVGITQIQIAANDAANKDLSNLTVTGEAKFNAKQDTISDLATIRSGAALGTTAVQPEMLAEYVTLDTTQTISGTKTFNSSQTLNGNTLKCFDFTRGTNPAATRNLNLYMTDSTALSGDNTAFGLFRTSVNPTGGVTSIIRAFKNNTAGTNDYAEIYVHYPITGNPYTHAPTPTDTTTTSGTQIATTGWVNSVGNNVVHKTGDETISGTKTFNDSTTLKHSLQLQSTEIAKGTNPSSTKYQILAFYDKNGTVQENKTGQIYTTYTQSGMLSISMDVFQPVSGSRNSAGISVKYPASGNAYAEAPASDVTNSIVTTVNKSKGDNGYFQLGNGLIIQWGTNAATSSGTAVTLPKAYSSNNSYSVVICRNAGNSGDIAAVNRTSATTFTIATSNGNSRNWQWIAIGY